MHREERDHIIPHLIDLALFKARGTRRSVCLWFYFWNCCILWWLSQL